MIKEKTIQSRRLQHQLESVYTLILKKLISPLRNLPICFKAFEDEQLTHSKPSVWIATTHSFHAKKTLGLASTQTALHKRSPCSMRALDLRAQAAAVVAERF